MYTVAPSILFEQSAFDAPTSQGPAACAAWSNHAASQQTHSKGFRSELLIHHPEFG
jgi:hypothetical protein